MSGNLHEEGGAGQAELAAHGRLTFDRLAAHVEAAEARSELRPLYVQVRTRGVVICGRLVEAIERKGERPGFFRADTCIGSVWASERNTRMCSAVDGRCVCEAAVARGRVADTGDGRFVPPLGKTGVTA